MQKEIKQHCLLTTCQTSFRKENSVPAPSIMVAEARGSCYWIPGWEAEINAAAQLVSFLYSAHAVVTPHLGPLSPPQVA